MFYADRLRLLGEDNHLKLQKSKLMTLFLNKLVSTNEKLWFRIDRYPLMDGTVRCLSPKKFKEVSYLLNSGLAGSEPPEES